MRRIANIFITLSLIPFLFSCSAKDNKEFKVEDVKIEYDSPNIVEIEKPTNINSRDEFTKFLDYSILYGTENQFMYTTVSDEYLSELRANLDYEARWAGQYGALAHNFLIEYDFTRLDEGLVGSYGYIFPYATLKNEVNEYTSRVYSYSYYNDILINDNNRGYSINDFYLAKNNKGYLEVSSSEAMFYAIENGYMPYIAPENKELREMLSKILGILNRILREGMSEYEKYEAMYSYLTNQVYYDYKMLNNKEGNPRLYRCYYLEGAIMDGLATCDGLTKALSVFCNLEGIESFHVGAVSYHGGHAYNYTNINDKWYLSCVTNGSHIESYKGMMYLDHTSSYFLSDLKPAPSWEFESEYRLDIAKLIDTKFNYCANTKIIIDSKEYSLEITNKDDAITILNYVDELAYDNKIALDI